MLGVAEFAVAAGPPDGLQVNVVNTPANPVPVSLQGTSTVSGNVAVTNTSSNPVPVTIPSNVSVIVVNPADLAKAQGIQHPYQHREICEFTIGTSECLRTFQTPANQRLVVEYISSNCGMDAGLQLQKLEITTQLGGPNITTPHYVTAPDPVITPFGAAIYTFGQTVRLYADQNSPIQVMGVTSGVVSSAGTSCFVSFSGQAIDTP
jgi:hypothetical protein